MKKFKIIVFILLIFSFILLLFFGIFGTSLSFLSSKEIKENRKLKEDLISELKINNLDTIYDKNNNIYYLTVSENYENNIYALNIKLEDGFKYKIVGETFNIIKVDYSKLIKVIIYNDKYYYETKIQLTNLPLINIETKEDITTNDTKSIFNYINSNNSDKTVTSNSKIHIRGASSQRFDKKSYKINMYDKSYNEEKEIIISDFYYGNSFVLDAVYRDTSKIRNVLATELWNEMSNDFSNININSEFIELFINNEYKGLYVLTEPVNRRSLNLNKTSFSDTSVIIKAISWLTFNNSDSISNIESITNSGYEIKYPNDEDLYPAVWEKFYSLTSNFYDANISNNFNIIKESFNLDNYVDIIIYNAFINNGDNYLKKNNYFYLKSLNDNYLYVQPWDMEFTFGLNYSSKGKNSTEKDMDNYSVIYTEFYHEYAPEINELLIDRYWELRKSILTKEYFNRLLDEYKNKLTKGAALRDSNIWYEYDVDEEIEDIRTWIYKRLDFFDEYVKGLENE